MFAVAAHFNAAGVHIRIESASPPRSALGGSSVAAVALVGALARCRALAGGADLQRDQIVRRAHEIEATVAGVPCGIQDQLAAAYGGINIWHWNVDANGLAVGRESLMTSMAPETFQTHVLVAYGGLPHESRDVNGTWVRQFLAGKQRSAWQRVAECVRWFSKAFANGDWAAAAEAMNAETAIRREMTPEVLDDLGTALVEAAAAKGCGGRFTGAGGGGCLWAVGEAGPIRGLRMVWADLLSGREEARFLDVNPDWQGLTVVTGAHRESGT
jgi:D-glycero-alpha-D-manno-heptose-7-phosphate kinase